MAKDFDNPWTEIWIRPKKIMRRILDANPKRIILWLAIVSGMLSGLNFTLHLWIRYPEQNEFHKILFIIGILIVGAMLGIIYLYFGGWLYSLTGSWVGGKGKFIDLKSAVGWSNYPFIFVSLLSIFNYLSVPNPWVQAIFGLLNLIVAIWAFVILIHLIAEAHQFAAWKSLATLIIAFILIFIVFLILMLIFPLLIPLFSLFSIFNNENYFSLIFL
jgi:hypothetical protein